MTPPAPAGAARASASNESRSTPSNRAIASVTLVAFSVHFGSDYPGEMHFTDNPLFEQDGEAIKHKCFLSFQVPADGGTNLLLLGYEDELVRVDGTWKFRSRRVGPLQRNRAHGELRRRVAVDLGENGADLDENPCLGPHQKDA